MSPNARPDERRPGRSGQETEEAASEATQTSREAAQKGAEHLDRIGRATAEAGSQAAKTSADIVGRNVEAAQHVMRSGAEMAAQLTERSAHHFGRALGFSGDHGEQAAQSFTRNFGALMESSAVLSDLTRSIALEWINFSRAQVEQNLEQLDHLLHPRNPQEVVALQIEMAKKNLEELLGYTRRVAERSMQTTEQLAGKVERAAERAAA